MNRKLKELREKRGLSQAEVAEFIGISRQMYSKYESGEVDPSLKAIKAVCTLYAVSYEDLLDEKSADEKSALKKDSDKTPSSYSIDKNYGELSVASPAASCSAVSQNQMYGTANVLSQILELLPRLLYSEKAKLLTTVAQSMSNDVEAAQLAARNRPERLNHEEPVQPSYEEYSLHFEEMQKMAKEMKFNSHGVKWTREDMHER